MSVVELESRKLKEVVPIIDTSLEKEMALMLIYFHLDKVPTYDLKLFRISTIDSIGKGFETIECKVENIENKKYDIEAIIKKQQKIIKDLKNRKYKLRSKMEVVVTHQEKKEQALKKELERVKKEMNQLKKT